LGPPKRGRAYARPYVRFSSKTRVAFVLVILVVEACGARGRDDSAGVHRLFDEWWAFELEIDPLRATAVGIDRYDDRLPDVSAAGLEQAARRRRDFLTRLAAIPRDQAGRPDQISIDLAKREIELAIAEFEFKTYRIPILADDGFHIGFSRLPEEMPFRRLEDYDRYVSRLRAYPKYSADNIANMREGIRTGFTMPSVVLRGYEGTIAAHVVDDPEQSRFWRPFAGFPAAVPESARTRLRAAGRAAIAEAVVPAYREFLDFLTREYLHNARSTIAAADLPDGRRYYDWLIRRFTTLPLSADSIHRLGQATVARIRAEMDGTMREAGFAGSFPEFLRFLRTDPRFYAASADALLERASWLAKTIDGKLPALFKTLPRQPYTVAPVPSEIAPKYTGGRYIGAPLDGTRPGTYWVNTYNLGSRPLYVLPALTLHEAVPGHHLQVALAKEIVGLPSYRRYTYVDAFGEGWGLYSEWLGIEAGMYSTPYTRFGRLTYEMWRACRLVVDTGIHALGWSRERAMDFLASNTALSLHEVETETDRYISWPGQALAYKLGELKIRELRSEAERRLAGRFDVREFHDRLLRNGAVPLPILEEEVQRYLDSLTARP